MYKLGKDDYRGRIPTISCGGHADQKPMTQRSEHTTAQHLISFLSKYSMAALSSELAVPYRDHRLSGGKSNNTVRLELAMLTPFCAAFLTCRAAAFMHGQTASCRNVLKRTRA
jgi:hypothetical protein